MCGKVSRLLGVMERAGVYLGGLPGTGGLGPQFGKPYASGRDRGGWSVEVVQPLSHWG